MDAPLIFLSAGEVSGDLFAAGLLSALKQRCPALKAYGLGGPRLAAVGLNLLDDVRRFSAVGLSENLSSLPYMYGLKQRLAAWLRRLRPDVVILVDFQGLNLQLAEIAKSLGIPVIYFVAPQDWLWGFKSGVRRIAANVDLILSVFGPEAAFYQAQGLQVRFVGHPLRDLLPGLTQAEARQQLRLSADKKVICWMPGSRYHEVKRLLPVMQSVHSLLPADWQHLMPVAAEFLPKQALENFPAQPLGAEQRYVAMLAADVIIGASGSMVLEAALLARPVIALYRVSPLTYTIAKQLVRLPWITLPNILLQRDLVSEFVQHLPAERIKQALLAELKRSDQWIQAANELKQLLGEQGVYHRAAEEILAFLAFPSVRCRLKL